MPEMGKTIYWSERHKEIRKSQPEGGAERAFDAFCLHPKDVMSKGNIVGITLNLDGGYVEFSVDRKIIGKRVL